MTDERRRRPTKGDEEQAQGKPLTIALTGVLSNGIYYSVIDETKDLIPANVLIGLAKVIRSI
ncbi:hypothetical protein CLVI_22690 [Clostridium vincentii]|uniref:Uncharacterized protein n=1 Tax=Clostridium vincentii TaxID=52704 RepID=A0A2T0BD01_9CLOT|nr:hypothetical protein CLVI_22690 [Clostridium vincentii]